MTSWLQCSKNFDMLENQVTSYYYYYYPAPLTLFGGLIYHFQLYLCIADKVVGLAQGKVYGPSLDTVIMSPLW